MVTVDASVPAPAAPPPKRWTGIQVCEGTSNQADAGYVTLKKQTAESQLKGFSSMRTAAQIKGLQVGSHPEYSCNTAVDIDAMVTGIQVGTDFEADVDKLICTTTSGLKLWLRNLSGWEYEGTLDISTVLYSESVAEEEERREHQWDLDASVPSELFTIHCNYEFALR